MHSGCRVRICWRAAPLAERQNATRVVSHFANAHWWTSSTPLATPERWTPSWRCARYFSTTATEQDGLSDPSDYDREITEEEKLIFQDDLRQVMQEVRETENHKRRERFESLKNKKESAKSSATTPCPEAMSAETPVHISKPRDTHFTAGIHIENPEECKTLISHLESTLQLHRVASPCDTLTTASTVEELASVCHQALLFTKAFKYYFEALELYVAVAVAQRQKQQLESRAPFASGSTTEPTAAVEPCPQPINADKAERDKRLRIVDPQDENPASNFNQYSYTNPEGEIKTGAGRPGTFDIARCLGHIGVCYRDAGKLEKSKEFLMASFRMKQQTVGDYHESTAETLNNLGALYHAMGAYQEACETYEDTLQSLIGLLGGDATSSPYVAMAYYNLGLARHAQKQYALATIALSKARRVAFASPQVDQTTIDRIEAEIQLVKDHKAEEASFDLEGMSNAIATDWRR